MLAVGWPEVQWMPSGGLTLDELPDSDARFLPEYQLTQEWFEQTIQYLKEKEAAEAMRDVAEIQAEIWAQMDVGMDVETEAAGVEPPEGKTTRKSLD